MRGSHVWRDGDTFLTENIVKIHGVIAGVGHASFAIWLSSFKGFFARMKTKEAFSMQKRNLMET